MKKVLIPEDNDMNFYLFTEMLNEFDIELIQVKNGLQAVEYCDKYSDVCLILMDINMPVMGGEEAAVIIKQRHPEIPIISQTAYSVYGAVSEKNKSCFAQFIEKPINIEGLKAIIRKYCFDEK